MKNILVLFFIIACFSTTAQTFNFSEKQKAVSGILDAWHKAAAKANFEEYFGLMSKEAIFIGTDATENWTIPEFKDFAKPYFDQGEAWNFNVLQRHIFLNNSGKVAWFDELLDTQMGICRGSGVVQLKKGHWKIAQYVLSIAIPNENVSEVTTLKNKFDENLISKFKGKNKF